MSKNRETKDHSSYLFLVPLFLAFLAYYPSILEIARTNHVINIDDQRLIQNLANYPMTLDRVFSPTWSTKYYRPLIDFSYWVDQSLWGVSPFSFRLTNFLIHLANVSLVFFLGHKLFFRSKEKGLLALMAASLFAIHPTDVEAVSWIVGRTGPIATFWSLTAILFYLKGKLEDRWLYYPLSLLALILGMLSKEVALMAPVVILLFEGGGGALFGYPKSSRPWLIPAIIATAIALYGIFRSYGIEGKDFTLVFLDKISFESFIDHGLLAGASFGFYLKKFFFPYPLNIYIATIDYSLHLLFFCGVVLGGIFLFRRENLRAYLFLLLWAILGLCPALYVAISDVAWTKWAERFLYFANVPLSLAMAAALCHLRRLSSDRRFWLLPLLLFYLPFAWATAQRSFLWNDNISMWRDAAAKTPKNVTVQLQLGASYLQKKELEKAEKIFREALHWEGAKHQIYLNMGSLEEGKGKLEEAEKLYKRALVEADKDPNLSIMKASLKQEIYRRLSYVYGAYGDRKPDQKELFYGKAIESLKKAHELRKDRIIHLYRIGAIYMMLDRREEAKDYLERFIAGNPGERLLMNARGKLRRLDK